MILKELYIHQEDGKNYVAIGSGSEELKDIAQEKIGDGKFYKLESNMLNGEWFGWNNYDFYFLSESDFHLFNAYTYLEEGMEIVTEKSDFDRDDHDYFIYNERTESFNEIGINGNNHTDSIFARRKKPVPFAWINDRPPTEEDADENGNVAHPLDSINAKCATDKWHYWSFKEGMPWQTVEACKHFTAENPAPPFYRGGSK